ncbi:Uncharacterized protein EJ110_NYTH29334 [Nymphaea thermarum]|nr:Uncharacterized protein EJ110_NYTH29334 [Nymphaea thermarum]
MSARASECYTPSRVRARMSECQEQECLRALCTKHLAHRENKNVTIFISFPTSSKHGITPRSCGFFSTNWGPPFTTSMGMVYRIQLYTNFFGLPQHYPLVRLLLSSFLDIKRTSPDGNLNVADLLSFAISFATTPVALANSPPFPSVISMLRMAMPKSILIEMLMTSPSMPYGNDSSRITTFTTTMLSIDQISLWIGFCLTVYGSFACATGRSFRFPLLIPFMGVLPSIKFSLLVSSATTNPWSLCNKSSWVGRMATRLGQLSPLLGLALDPTPGGFAIWWQMVPGYGTNSSLNE